MYIPSSLFLFSEVSGWTELTVRLFFSLSLSLLASLRGEGKVISNKLSKSSQVPFLLKRVKKNLWFKIYYYYFFLILRTGVTFLAG